MNTTELETRCAKCKGKLVIFGAIIIAPPPPEYQTRAIQNCEKFYLCNECYYKFGLWMGF